MGEQIPPDQLGASYVGLGFLQTARPTCCARG